MKTSITVTPKAVEKIKAIMAQETPNPIALRFGVLGGGCSGFNTQWNSPI